MNMSFSDGSASSNRSTSIAARDFGPPVGEIAGYAPGLYLHRVRAPLPLDLSQAPQQ
jgi:hypothetical protein